MLGDHRAGPEYASMSQALGTAPHTLFGSTPRYWNSSRPSSRGSQQGLAMIVQESAFTPTTMKRGGTLMNFFKKLFCKKKLTPCEELTYRVEEHKSAQGSVYFYAIVTQDGMDTFATYYDGGPKWRYKKELYWRSQTGYKDFGGVVSCKVEFPDKDLAKDICIEQCREIRNLKHNRVVEEGTCQDTNR